MIIPANQIKCTNSREEIIQVFCDNLMNTIQEKAANGSHDCCFTGTAYYEISTGKLYATYQAKWKGDPQQYESWRYKFDDYADEIKKRFRDAGYVIKPTGYIGGVWQLTEDICW